MPRLSALDRFDPRRLQAAAGPRLRRVILLAAALGLCAGLVLSLRAMPGGLAGLRPGPILLLVLLAIPATVALNAWEFRLAARILGQRPGFGAALETTIVGTAANQLPLPGGTMVRVVALQAGGARLGQGVGVTLFVGLLWIGIACLYGGIWIWVAGAPALAAGFGALGLAVLVPAILGCLRQLGHPAIVARLAGVKLALVLLEALRLQLGFLALGLAADFGQTSTLSVSGVAGAAVAILPGGLGIREAMAALLAPVAGLTPAGAFLAVFLNRVLELALIAPLAAWLGLRARS